MQIYVVRQGDSIFSIARAFGTNANRIIEANELPERTVEYKGSPIKVYFGNPDEEGSIELTKWSNGWSNEMVTKVLSEMEETTGLPLADIGTDE